MKRLPGASPAADAMSAITRETLARESLQAAPPRERAVPIAALVCAGLLAFGWSQRREMWLIPERGLGYALGIVGLLLMTLLLLYSVRKRLRRGPLPLRHWFRVHMVLGLAGPTAILLHANFGLGSLNGRVALCSMLLVAGSGVAGRFVYARIHRGLYGERRQLEPLRREAAAGWGAAEAVMRVAPGIGGRLEAFEALALDPPAGPAAGLWRLLVIGSRARRLQRDAARALRASGLPSADMLGAALDEHLLAALAVARFAAWERVFSIWHAVHLPLCVLLFGAAAAHVVAVHLY